jgi:hypothetical protein
MAADVPTVSLIIVSRHRPAMLARCLTAVAQMDHPAFEVVVVADPAGLEVARTYPVKTVLCDERTSSAARTLGIVAAAGAVVAFIDDDAVPEPLWLAHLTRPFVDLQVVAAGGFVVGWNGISFEWKGGKVDRLLGIHTMPVPEDRISLHLGQPGIAVEIKGVNCAYRRDVLAEMGGFDPLLRYYLDETEVNLRIANRIGLTAIVPMARVHHRKAASAQRRADRTPLSLHDVGFSSAITLRRHGATVEEQAAARDAMRIRERHRLLAMVGAGRIKQMEVGPLMASLDQGFSEGTAACLQLLVPIGPSTAEFLPFPSPAREVIELVGRAWRTRTLRARARRLVAEGRIVRLFLLSPTALFHKLAFKDGYWCQSGGLFGKSDRNDPIFCLYSMRKRHARESERFSGGFRNS